MNIGNLKAEIVKFYDKVRAYRTLLLESRDPHIPKIIKNHEEIARQKTILIRDYAKLEVYIKKLGKNQLMNDGVWNIWYSPYDNAFSNDILVRTGPSIDAVINDLDYIIGKLEGMNSREFSTLLKSSKPASEKIVHPEAEKLIAKIEKAISLAEQKLLKGEELNELITDLKRFQPPKDVDEILKRKIEKIQREPNTAWSDTQGYAISGDKLLSPWRELFLELVVGSGTPSQKYFSPGSKDEIFEYLKTLIPGANSIKIYDNFIGDEILKLLEHTSKEAEIFILGRNFDSNFIKKLSAFIIYFNKNIKVKKSDASHARFYIVDGNVFNVDVSLRGHGVDKATLISPVIASEASKIINDYKIWWDIGTDV